MLGIDTPQGPPAHRPDPLDPSSRLSACPSDLTDCSPDTPARPPKPPACPPPPVAASPTGWHMGPARPTRPPARPTHPFAQLPACRPTHLWAHGSMSALGYWGCGGKMQACSAEVSGHGGQMTLGSAGFFFNRGCACPNTLLGI